MVLVISNFWGMGFAPSKFFLNMGLHQELPVYKASYDLLVEIFRFTKEFSMDYSLFYAGPKGEIHHCFI